MRCDFCRPHADPRKQRLCHEGSRLFHAYKEAGEKYAELSNSYEPPVFSLEEARKAMHGARQEYRNHTDGGTS